MSKLCVLLVGNIGSGKSTFAKALFDMDYITISRDRIRYAIGGGNYLFKPDLEPVVHKITTNMFKEFLLLGKNIVIDETNVISKSRADYIATAHNYGYEVMAISMPKFSKAESIKRRMSDNHGTQNAEVWESVWDRFNTRYQAPALKEGFDYLIQLENDYPTSQVWRLIGAAVNGS